MRRRRRTILRLNGACMCWLAAALLLIVFSASVLPGMGHALAGEDSLEQRQISASLAHPCGHGHPSVDESGDLVDRCSGDEAQAHLLDCDQMCAVVGILVDARSEDAPPAASNRAGFRPDRLGRVPSGILRPPRLGMAA